MKKEKTEQTKENKIEEPMVKAPQDGAEKPTGPPKRKQVTRAEKKLKKRRKSEKPVAMRHVMYYNIYVPERVFLRRG